MQNLNGEAFEEWVKTADSFEHIDKVWKTYVPQSEEMGYEILEVHPID